MKGRRRADATVGEEGRNSDLLHDGRRNPAEVNNGEDAVKNLCWSVVRSTKRLFYFLHFTSTYQVRTWSTSS